MLEDCRRELFAFERYPQPESIAFSGSVSDVVASLTRDEQSVWPAARLVRATLECTQLDDADRVETIRRAAQFLLDRYDRGAEASVMSLADELLQRFGNRALIQPNDIATVASSTPALSRERAGRIIEMTDGPILMIALCHGGLVAAAQSFLYCRRERRDDSVFYPVRFSTSKQMDKAPRLSAGEISYLQEAAVGRTLVVYDEDTRSGSTIRDAIGVFKRDLNVQYAIGIASTDNRLPQAIAEQGAFWERCLASYTPAPPDQCPKWWRPVRNYYRWLRGSIE